MKMMSTYVNSDLWIGVLDRLGAEHDIEFCCLIASSKYEKEIRKRHNPELFHSTSEVKYHEPELTSCLSNLSQDMLTNMSYYETLFLKIMDRYGSDTQLTFKSMSYDERVGRYHRTLSYWYGVLTSLKPDIVLFNFIPHLGYDWVIYGLCEKLNIKTLLFYPSSPLPDCVIPFNRLEEGANFFLESDVADGAGKLSDKAKQALLKIRSSYNEGKPKYVDFGAERYRKEKNNLRATVGYMKLRLKVFLFPDLIGNTTIRRKIWNYQSIWRREKLKNEYMLCSKKVDFNQLPYIYVALQVEPEAQACPMGGKFANQYLMIKQIASCLPKGWRIVVKEHVNAFSYYPDRAKSQNYYKQLMQISRVELADLSTDPYQLIDKAKVTASVSGTTCWESVVRGTPTLLFGYNWFSNCEGVFQVHSITQCVDAFKEIEKGYVVNAQKINEYINLVEDYSIKGYVYDFYKQYSKLSKDSNIKSISNGVIHNLF